FFSGLLANDDARRAEPAPLRDRRQSDLIHEFFHHRIAERELIRREGIEIAFPADDVPGKNVGEAVVGRVTIARIPLGRIAYFLPIAGRHVVLDGSELVILRPRADLRHQCEYLLSLLIRRKALINHALDLKPAFCGQSELLSDLTLAVPLT